MSIVNRNTHNKSRSIFSGRISCILLVFFFLVANGPTTTANWLCSAFITPIISVDDQPGDHLATAIQQLEVETDFSKDFFLFAPALLRISLPVVSGCCKLLLFFSCLSLLQRWFVPASPRPPPQFIITAFI